MPVSLLQIQQNEAHKSWCKWGGNINKQMKNSTYISVTFEKTQKTPCHESPQGSPPKESHFSRGGKFREIYKLFRAITEEKNNTK